MIPVVSVAGAAQKHVRPHKAFYRSRRILYKVWRNIKPSFLSTLSGET